MHGRHKASERTRGSAAHSCPRCGCSHAAAAWEAACSPPAPGAPAPRPPGSATCRAWRRPPWLRWPRHLRQAWCSKCLYASSTGIYAASCNPELCGRGWKPASCMLCPHEIQLLYYAGDVSSALYFQVKSLARKQTSPAISDHDLSSGSLPEAMQRTGCCRCIVNDGRCTALCVWRPAGQLHILGVLTCRKSSVEGCIILKRERPCIY
jgi:hypothetical protein